MNKLVRDGQVAVVYSPGFGAGWSTWHSEHREYLCMDAEIAQAVLDGDNEKAARIASDAIPELYTGGASDLCVKWVNQGEQFEINEYDGSESVVVIGQQHYMVA